MEVKRVPEGERILMKDFPLMPGDIVVATLECVDCGEELPMLGEVKSVFSRNPDPGVTIELKTKEDLILHLGGEHNNVKLSRYDSMWAHILFVTPCCLVFKTTDIYTYNLVAELKNNNLAKIGPELFFANFQNFVLQAGKHYQLSLYKKT